MTRRKRWVTLALLLVPAALVITTFSVMRLSGHHTAARTPHLVLPNGISASKGDMTLLASSSPALNAPDNVNDARHFDTAQTAEESGRNQDSKELPAPTATLADNYTAPPSAFDSYVAQEATDHTADSWNGDHHYRGFDFGLIGGAGGGSGVSGKGGTPQNTTNNSNNNEHGGSQTNSSSSSSSSSSSAGSESSTQTSSNGSSSSASSEYSSGSGPIIVDTEQPKPQVGVPEPATWSLFGLALLGVMLSRRQRA